LAPVLVQVQALEPEQALEQMGQLH